MVPNAVRRLSIPCLAAALAALPICAAGKYPGNANFRNVAATLAARSRTDWVTNVATMVGSARNPGTATPVDWSRAQSITNGVDYIPAVLTDAGGWPRTIVCHLVRMDLSTPNLRFTGTDRCEGWGDPMPEDYASGRIKRTVREKTGDFLARNRGPKSRGGKERDAVLAWNNAAWSPWVPPYSNLWGDPDGPLYSDGVQVSTIATGYGTHGSSQYPNGIFTVFKDGTADIVPDLTETLAKKAWFTAPAFVARLVSGGTAPPHGDMSVGPRTAIGLSRDKKTAYLIVCDGRRDDWSPGCDFPSLSTLLVAMGCWEAINLDGGGSSTICAWDAAKNRPMLLNRPCNLVAWHSAMQRDNGSNAAIYFREPVAMLGTWRYDDMDCLMRDIAEGRTPPGENGINMLRDATFTAANPCIPCGAYSIYSRNGATISWENGVGPRVVAGTRVAFRNIRFGEGSRTIAVESGATVVLAGADLDAVETRDRAGLVIAGALTCPLRVSCAAATNRHDVFAFSTLPLAKARVVASQIVSGSDGKFIAVASGTDGKVRLSWDTAADRR